MKQTKKQTKGQRLLAAERQRKQKRMSNALRNWMKTMNPSAAITGASVVRLKGGVLKVKPLTNRAAGR